MNHPYFMLTLKYKDLKIYLLRDAAGFLKITLYRPLIYHLKSSIARKSQMWWYARGNSGGSWLPEEKKLICGPEEEIVVAHGRLPSPDHRAAL